MKLTNEVQEGTKTQKPSSWGNFQLNITISISFRAFYLYTPLFTLQHGHGVLVT